MKTRIEIPTVRFILRELAETDVTERYLSWLGDADAQHFITAAAQTRNLADLRLYVRDRVGRDSVLFLGIFDRVTGAHIGNIKYEPVDSRAGYAIMGILIGDPAFRGKGVTPEVLRSSGEWLRSQRNIRQIALGVSRDNPAAIRAYEKVGFVETDTPYISKTSDSVLTMVWHL